MDLSDLKWVSKRNLQTFWDGIKGSLFGDLAFHEDGAESAHAYSAGDLLGHESHLYRATSSIAAGDTLESGVNMERTLVDAEIKRSRQSVNTEFDPRLSNILGDLATVEAEMVATQNYAVGAYIVIGDYFYRVTDAITSGDTLAVGTNIEQTNVGAEMSKLNLNLVSDTASDWWNPNISANNWQVAGTWTVPKSGMWIISVSKTYTSGRPIGVSVKRSNGTVLFGKEVDGSVSGDWAHLYNVVGFARLEKDEVISFYGKNSGEGKNDISFKAARVGL